MQCKKFNGERLFFSPAVERKKPAKERKTNTKKSHELWRNSISSLERGTNEGDRVVEKILKLSMDKQFSNELQSNVILETVNMESLESVSMIVEMSKPEVFHIQHS